MFTDFEKAFNNALEVQARTYNGAVTNATTESDLADLFSMIGSFRNGDKEEIYKLFLKALEDHPQTAIAILLWARDVREGAGERAVPGYILHRLFSEISMDDELALELLTAYLEMGRWDDLLPLLDTNASHLVLDMITKALNEGDALCAKWMPRERSAKGHYAKKIRKHLQVSPRTYRKILSNRTDVVETKMCAKEFHNIDYKTVPSKANLKYRKAFLRNDQSRYEDYISDVKSGKAKMNAGVLAPHEIVSRANGMQYHVPSAEKAALDAMWNSLKDSSEFTVKGNVLPMIDVSGSMTVRLGGGGSESVLDAAVGIGTMIAEKSTGMFKNKFLTFSERPAFVDLDGCPDIFSKVMKVVNSDWGFNTNLSLALYRVARACQRMGSTDGIPDTLLVLSDMEFDAACGHDVPLQREAEEIFQSLGVPVPRIVYWNLNARLGNSPVTVRDDNTATVSGYSTNLMKSLLAGESLNQYEVMMRTLAVERYVLRSWG